MAVTFETRAANVDMQGGQVGRRDQRVVIGPRREPSGATVSKAVATSSLFDRGGAGLQALGAKMNALGGPPADVTIRGVEGVFGLTFNGFSIRANRDTNPFEKPFAEATVEGVNGGEDVSFPLQVTALIQHEVPEKGIGLTVALPIERTAKGDRYNALQVDIAEGTGTVVFNHVDAVEGQGDPIDPLIKAAAQEATAIAKAKAAAETSWV